LHFRTAANLLPGCVTNKYSVVRFTALRESTDPRKEYCMSKTKLTAVALLGAACFTPYASAQTSADEWRSNAQSSPPTTTAQLGSDPTRNYPYSTAMETARSGPNESPATQELGRARQPGMVPSPYVGMPASGHPGDEFFYKQFGGVSPP
jgi:hypothetical protein